MSRFVQKAIDFTDNEYIARALARFYTKTIPEPNTGCLLWLGSVRSGDGRYGAIRFQGISRAAHRLIKSLDIGRDLEAGEVVMHTCDNVLCVNVDHLMVGTQQENVVDMWSKGRATQRATQLAKLTHCKHGHAFTEENTYWFTNSSGSRGRQCNTCRRVVYLSRSERGRATLRSEGLLT